MLEPSRSQDDIDQCYAWPGEHCPVFIDLPDDLAIVDILHARSDPPARNAVLKARL
ncbi:hypothetical protein [Limimaricola soesokkakensis]|uniref:hypothetical protein n=1 Tax=Limimaricola soesokkakensis TaxID=1343159 RepID=UPI003514CAD5